MLHVDDGAAILKHVGDTVGIRIPKHPEYRHIGLTNVVRHRFDAGVFLAVVRYAGRHGCSRLVDVWSSVKIVCDRRLYSKVAAASGLAKSFRGSIWDAAWQERPSVARAGKLPLSTREPSAKHPDQVRWGRPGERPCQVPAVHRALPSWARTRTLLIQQLV